MNFFGHATVAGLRSEAPRFVLGAMLPDLTSMAGVRIEDVGDSEVARGVALHHETDRAFHAAPPFQALCAGALETLEQAGVARGPARAVGHVGSELLLDGLLSHNRQARAIYARSLEVALADRLEQTVRFRSEADPARMRLLLQRLANAPLPEAYRDPALVCDRLFTILAHRPRLALQSGDRSAVELWLHGARRDLERDQAALLALLS
jgi:hypothetical protein